MAGKIVLVTGGARSGKSSFAERYAKKYGKHIAYLATAEAWDDEMQFRIACHRADRPATWTTYEAPREAEHAIREAGKGHDMILFDCITIYLSNLLCGFTEADLHDTGRVYAAAESCIGRLIDAARDVDSTVVFVTNEVGSGIVPENALARLYRDLAGLVNQQLAAAADEAYLVVSGLAIDLHAAAVSL